MWPSILYAAELAAWDVLLGVALVFAALALDECERLRVIRIGRYSAGALCLAGIVGPMLGRMPLQRIGIVGYAVVRACVRSLLGNFVVAPAHAGNGAEEGGASRGTARSLNPLPLARSAAWSLTRQPVTSRRIGSWRSRRSWGWPEACTDLSPIHRVVTIMLKHSRRTERCPLI